MAAGRPRPDELNEYSFPWGPVLSAMAASGLLGAAAWEWLVSEHVWTSLLGSALAWFALAVFWLGRTARDEARLWKQRLAREEDLVAAAVQAAGLATSADARPSRPAP